VGSHLVDRLVAQNHSVTVLDDLSSGAQSNLSAQAKFIEGNVCDPALITRLIEESDACYHLAAIASVQKCREFWAESHAVNLTAFVGLLESVARRKKGVIPVVYASSAAVYGNADASPLHEKLPLRPISTYGADKVGCELHAHAAGHATGVPTFGLRPFNIYGTRQNPLSPYSGVISIFADRIKRGESLTIYGDGKQTRDFIAIHDVIDHFILAMDKATFTAPVCNVATGKEVSVLHVAQKLAKILGQEAKIVFAPVRKGDITHSVADTSQAQAVLGCEAKISIDDGLLFVREL
jgi:UDP-glucose 4-epimerase